jgi:hypothetical protein
MTDDPGPEDPHAAEPEPKKGKGCFLGGLATVGAVFAGLVIGGIVTGALGAVGAVLAPILAIALLIFVGFKGRETPGFLLGMGLIIAISLAIGTGCTALFLV